MTPGLVIRLELEGMDAERGTRAGTPGGKDESCKSPIESRQSKIENDPMAAGPNICFSPFQDIHENKGVKAFFPRWGIMYLTKVRKFDIIMTQDFLLGTTARRVASWRFFLRKSARMERASCLTVMCSKSLKSLECFLGVIYEPLRIEWKIFYRC